MKFSDDTKREHSDPEAISIESKKLTVQREVIRALRVKSSLKTGGEGSCTGPESSNPT